MRSRCFRLELPPNRCPTHNAIDGRTRHLRQGGNLNLGKLVGRPQRTDLNCLRIAQCWLPTTQTAPRTSCRQSIARALAEKLTFKMCERSEERKDEAACSSPCVQPIGQRDKPALATLSGCHSLSGDQGTAQAPADRRPALLQFLCRSSCSRPAAVPQTAEY